MLTNSVFINIRMRNIVMRKHTTLYVDSKYSIFLHISKFLEQVYNATLVQYCLNKLFHIKLRIFRRSEKKMA